MPAWFFIIPGAILALVVAVPLLSKWLSKGN